LRKTRAQAGRQAPIFLAGVTIMDPMLSWGYPCSAEARATWLPLWRARPAEMPSAGVIAAGAGR